MEDNTQQSSGARLDTGVSENIICEISAAFTDRVREYTNSLDTSMSLNYRQADGEMPVFSTPDSFTHSIEISHEVVSGEPEYGRAENPFIKKKHVEFNGIRALFYLEHATEYAIKLLIHTIRGAKRLTNVDDIACNDISGYFVFIRSNRFYLIANDFSIKISLNSSGDLYLVHRSEDPNSTGRNGDVLSLMDADRILFFPIEAINSFLNEQDFDDINGTIDGYYISNLEPRDGSFRWGQIIDLDKIPPHLRGNIPDYEAGDSVRHIIECMLCSLSNADTFSKNVENTGYWYFYFNRDRSILCLTKSDGEDTFSFNILTGESNGYNRSQDDLDYFMSLNDNEVISVRGIILEYTEEEKERLRRLINRKQVLKDIFVNNIKIGEQAYKNLFMSKDERALLAEKDGSLEWCNIFFRIQKDQESKSNLDYIVRICNTAVIDYSGWNFKRIFFNDNNRIVVSSQRDLNAAIFMDRVPGDFLNASEYNLEDYGIKDVTDEDINKLYNDMSLKFVTWSNKLATSRDQLEEEHYELTRKIRLNSQKLRAIRRRISSAEEDSNYNRIGLKKNLEKIVKDGVFGFVGFFKDYIILRNIKPFNVLTHYEGRNYRINVGTFLFYIDPSTYKVKVLSEEEGQTPFLSYRHPYLPANDWLCLGTAYDIIQKHLVENDLHGMTRVIRDLMTSYDGENPYCNIRHFIKWDKVHKEVVNFLNSSDSDDEDDFNSYREELHNSADEYGCIALTEDRELLLGTVAAEHIGYDCYDFTTRADAEEEMTYGED